MDIDQPYEARTSSRNDGGVIVQVERRRRWSDATKLAILKEPTEPGVIVSAVARRRAIVIAHGVGKKSLARRLEI
jgi:transposase